MALGMGVPVIPVSQWGAHEVLQYGNDWGKLRTWCGRSSAGRA